MPESRAEARRKADKRLAYLDRMAAASGYRSTSAPAAYLTGRADGFREAMAAIFAVLGIK